MEIFERSVVIQSSYKKEIYGKKMGMGIHLSQRNLYTHIFDKIEIAHRIAVDMG